MSGESARAGAAARAFGGGGFPEARFADGGDGGEALLASRISAAMRGFGGGGGRPSDSMPLDAALRSFDGAPHDVSLLPRNVKVNSVPNNGVRLEWDPPTSVAAHPEPALRRCTYTIHILMPGQPQEIASTQQTNYLVYRAHAAWSMSFLFGVRTKHPTLGCSSIVFNGPDMSSAPVVYHDAAVPGGPGAHGGGRRFNEPASASTPSAQLQLQLQQHPQPRGMFAAQQHYPYGAYAQCPPGAAPPMQSMPPLSQLQAGRPPPPSVGMHGGGRQPMMPPGSQSVVPSPYGAGGFYGAPQPQPGWSTSQAQAPRAASPAPSALAAAPQLPPPPSANAPAGANAPGPRPVTPCAAAPAGRELSSEAGEQPAAPARPNAPSAFDQPGASPRAAAPPAAHCAATAPSRSLSAQAPPLSRTQTLRPEDAAGTLQVLRRTVHEHDLSKCISLVPVAEGQGAQACEALLNVPGQGVYELPQALHAIAQALDAPAALAEHRTAFLRLMQHLALRCDRGRFPRMEFLHGALRSAPSALVRALGVLNALAFETVADVVVLQLIASFLQPRDTADVAGCRPLVKLYRQSHLFGEAVLLSLSKLKSPLTYEVQNVCVELIPFWDAALGTLPHDASDARAIANVIGRAAAHGSISTLLDFLHYRLETLRTRTSLSHIFLGFAPVLRILGAVLKCDQAARVVAAAQARLAFVATLVRIACDMLLGENSVRDLLAAMLFELLALAALHPKLHGEIFDLLHVHLKLVLQRKQPQGGRRARPLLPRLTEALCCMHVAIIRGGRAPISTLIIACRGDASLARALNDRLVALVISGSCARAGLGDAARALAFPTSFQLLEGNECGLAGKAQLSTAACAALDLDAAECCRRQELRVECSATSCGLGDECTNRRLRQRKWARVREDEARLRVVEPVREGELIIEAFGEIFCGSLVFADALKQSGVAWPPELCFLSLGGSASVALDVSRAGSLARLIAHSPTSPNCQFVAWLVDGQPRLGVYALCAVPAEAVLTADFGAAALGHATRSIPTWWPQALTPQQSTVDVRRPARAGGGAAAAAAAADAAAVRPAGVGRQAFRAAPRAARADIIAPEPAPAEPARPRAPKRALADADADADHACDSSGFRSIRARRQDWSATEERALAALTVLARNVSNPLVTFRRALERSLASARGSTDRDRADRPTADAAAPDSAAVAPPAPRAPPPQQFGEACELGALVRMADG